jgi:membrane-bound ClpP family serine protease
MPNWKEILDEINARVAVGSQTALDDVRRKYLGLMHEHTKRNVIAYYSGWLQKGAHADGTITDKDKNALMVTINKMDRTKGLDLILHTPGGDIAATESIVDYIHSMFGDDIRAIIPQISMSAGTMIALSCKSIMMGKQSNLGPIDPQINGVPCQAVIDEFNKAKEDIKANPLSASLWSAIIAKYHPTFLGSCQHAINWSENLAQLWIERNMLKGESNVAKKVIKEFSDHAMNKSHARHISKKKCEELGLKIETMEDDQKLQDLILSIHHSFMHTFTHSIAVKVVENQFGIAYVEALPHNPFAVQSARPNQVHGPGKQLPTEPVVPSN